MVQNARELNQQMESLSQQIEASHPPSGNDRTLTTQEITMQQIMSHHINDDSGHRQRETALQSNTAHLPFAQTTSSQKAQEIVQQILQVLDVQAVSVNKKSKLVGLVQDYQKQFSQENVKIGTQVLRLSDMQEGQPEQNQEQIANLEQQLFQLEQSKLNLRAHKEDLFAKTREQG